MLSECLRGFSVTLLTALDGGTAPAEKGRIYVVDEEDTRLSEGLHDDFVGHLFDTGACGRRSRIRSPGLQCAEMNKHTDVAQKRGQL